MVLHKKLDDILCNLKCLVKLINTPDYLVQPKININVKIQCAINSKLCQNKNSKHVQKYTRILQKLKIFKNLCEFYTRFICVCFTILNYNLNLL